MLFMHTPQLTNMGRGIRSGNPAWSPDRNWITYSVVEVAEWSNLVIAPFIL